MKKAVVGLFVLVLAPVAPQMALAQDATATLDAAAKAMGITNLTSIEYAGSGSSYNFGQAVNVHLPWPHFVLKTYVADINYATPAMRQEMFRVQDDGTPPFGGNQSIQLVSGNDAWNVGANGMPGAAPANVAERQLQIWLTPAGFIKGAVASKATVKAEGASKVVTFMTPDRHKVEGVINAQNLVEKTETWIDDPVLGDMPVVTTFSNYQDVGGVKFPMKIMQTEGGYPFLDLTVSSVKPNGAAAIDVPAIVRNAQVPAAQVETMKLGNGVWYLGGGSHHSLLVEFKDHLVVIEAPLDESRSNAVIAEVHKLVPGKPIRYLINTHNHFDHLGGVRTYAAEGATIIAPLVDKGYYEKFLNAPRTLNPDQLAKSGKKVKVEGVDGKRVLTDGAQSIELYVWKFDHNDAMLFPYLPKEKLLVQADMAVAPPANGPAPRTANPVSLALYNDIEARKLDVAQIAGIHGGISPWKDLLAMAGKPATPPQTR
jgi:glyoxylase-like metal-dependent hydrolase (beta-lactamase superfamily II)